MHVVALNESTERLFWDHVNRDPLQFFWFIYDWKVQRDKTKIWLALDQEEIAGLLLVHREFVIQFRGSREAVRRLLEHAPAAEEAEVQAPPDCEDLVSAKYRSQHIDHMMLMYLPRGEEKIQITTEPVRLGGAEDAEEVAAVMREADPVWWGEMTAERLATGMKDAYWVGIRQDDKIASLGSTRFTDLGICNIGVIATREEYRNRGYATSITSTLAREILGTSHTAIIHVLADNAPAVRTYSKVGFKPYWTVLLMKA